MERKADPRPGGLGLLPGATGLEPATTYLEANRESALQLHIFHI